MTDTESVESGDRPLPSVAYNMVTSWGAWWPRSVSASFYMPGCFRCHDDNHVADDGEILTRDCNACHTIVNQEGPEVESGLSLAGGEFVHPEDIDEAWKEMNCSECHGP